jgi:hypothetical protein
VDSTPNVVEQFMQCTSPLSIALTIFPYSRQTGVARIASTLSVIIATFGLVPALLLAESLNRTADLLVHFLAG